MKTIKFNWRTPYPRVITVGMETDHNAEDVRFGVPMLEGEHMLLYITAGNYSDVIQLDHGVWHPSRTHTQRPARFEAYIERRKGDDIVWHSEPFAMIVDKLPPTKKKLEQAYPTAIEEALRAVDMLTGVGARAVTLPPGSEATVDIETDEDGNRVIVFGIPRGQNGGGGGGGGGADGYSPTIDVSVISGGYRLSITDINGSRSVDIMDGKDGKNGAAGKDGVSATHSWSGTTLTVTSASGTSSANLKGEKGDTGADGRTPVKGTDYYTAADKAEMVTMVLAALPTWTGGSY